MKLLLAETVLGWKRVCRGPTLMAAVVTAAVCLLALPGFGPESTVRAGYGLALLWAIQTVTALWVGGTAYALDRERHRLTLTFAKPHGPWALWWGRWAGTLPLLLALTAVNVLLLWPRGFPDGRRVLSPELPAPGVLARGELEALREQGRVPEGVSEGRLLRAVADGIRTRFTTLAPDAPRLYRFPAAVSEPSGGLFRLDGAPFFGARAAIRLRVTLRCGGAEHTVLLSDVRESGAAVPLPEGFCRPGMPVEAELCRLDREPGASVIYREYENVSLLLPGVSAGANTVRFCLFLFVMLAMASALGAALGCCLSLPVTLFAGTLAVLAVAAASLAPETTVAEESATLWASFSAAVSSGLSMPFRALRALDPLYALTEGEALPLSGLLAFCLRTAAPWIAVCSLFGALSPVRDENP